jgi:hypothetical protein
MYELSNGDELQSFMNGDEGDSDSAGETILLDDDETDLHED